MRLTHRARRLKLAWLLAPPFVYFARPSAVLFLVGAVLALLGLVVRALSANAIYKDRALAVRGPYAHLRHPLYLGSLLVGSGLAVAGGRTLFLPLFLLLFAWIYRRAVEAEEAEMEARFGEEYLRYKARVPAWVPRLDSSSVEGDPWVDSWEAGPASALAVDSAPDPLLPPSGPLRLYRRNQEWKALLGALAGFGLLWLRMVVE